jgi:tRNA uridine 5-carboxymethylaminomethyl modification enzyme
MIGKERYSGGRHLRDSEEVEPPSVGLAQTLARFRFPLGRLKTGTPARIDGNTINWDACTIQPSENPAQPFSHIRQFLGEQPPNIVKGTLIDCYMTRTNEETHKLVMDYAHTLPEYDGMGGKGNGPRYCPSIFKKVERFPDRTGHNSFLEPEGLNTNLVYPNGMSGPYPVEIQEKILRTMPGLEKVEIIRPGYDVEYDFVNPQSLTHTLETKTISGLFLAGQICGTTGYEEAAAQGIIAGANAGRAAVASYDGKAAPALVLGRDEGYIGVLIDDLVTRGTQEPYRMFTSRSEYRISLRQDNADLRLTRKGIEYGLVNDEQRIASIEARETMIEDRVQELKNFKLFVTEWAERGGDVMGGDAMNRKGREGHKKSAEEILGMPHVTLEDVEKVIVEHQSADGNTAERMKPSPSSIYDTVEATVKYQSYVSRQSKDMDSWRKSQGVRIPPDLVYDHATLPTLSKEELEKLSKIRPANFAEASKISGITPQSLVYLYHFVSKRSKDRDLNKLTK